MVIMTNLDDFRSSLELLLEDKKKKLEYYYTRIDDYTNRAKRAKEEIEKLDASLSAKATKGD